MAVVSVFIILDLNFIFEEVVLWRGLDHGADLVVGVDETLVQASSV